MKPGNFRAVALALVLFLGIADSGVSQLPVARLSRLIPSGAQVGTTTRIQTEGRDLEGAHSLIFSSDRIEVEPVGGHEGVFDARIPEDLAPGYYEARVVGTYGVSNPRVFEVGILEEVSAKDGRNEREGAQKLSLGQTVNAAVVASAFDHYTFTAEADSQIVIRVSSTSIHSRMRPAIAVRQGNRELLSSRIRERIVFRPLEDGDYELWISDHIFRGGDEYYYRLSLSEELEIRSIYPPLEGLPEMEAYEIYGWNIDGAEAVANGALFRLMARGESLNSEAMGGLRLGTRRPSSVGLAAPSRRWSFGDTGSTMSRNPLYPTSATTIFEDEAQETRSLEIPSTVAGRFYPPKDHDHYEFLAIEDEELWVEVEAERFGEPVKPFGLIQRVAGDASGEKLIDIKELSGKSSPIGGVAFDVSSTDISESFKVGQSGRYRVTLWDLFNTSRVDPGLAYRIYIGPARPDYSLVALPEPPHLDPTQRAAATWGHFLRKGEVAPIRVLALREHGFNGEIRISCPDAPEGVEFFPAVIRAGESEGLIFARASMDAPGWTGRLTIQGVADINGRDVERNAKSGVVIWDVADARTEQVISEWNPNVYSGVSETESAPIRIERAGGENPIQIVAGDSKTLEFDIFRRDGIETALEITLGGDKAVEELAAISVPPDVSQVEALLDSSALKWEPGTYAIYLQAKPTITYAKEEQEGGQITYGLYSNPVEIEVREASE